MSDTPGKRPRQATLAGWLIMLGSGFVVILAFDRVAGLRSIESQQSLRDFLAEPPGNELGLGVDDLSATIRALCLVAAACASAAAILGFHALKRSTSARMGLAVLAVPLLVSGILVADFMAPLVVTGAVMLWLQPSRDWFAGVQRRPDPTASPEPPEALATTVPTPDPTPSEPRAMTGFGVQQASTAPVTAPAAPGAPAATGRPAARSPRPTALSAACILTWVVCGLVIVGLALSILVLLAAPEALSEEIRRQDPGLAEDGLTISTIRAAAYLAAAVAVPWCAAAIAFAVVAFRGAAWGRVALLISAAAAGALCLATTFASPPLIVLVAANAVTVGLLLRGDVREWFVRR